MTACGRAMGAVGTSADPTHVKGGARGRECGCNAVLPSAPQGSVFGRPTAERGRRLFLTITITIGYSRDVESTSVKKAGYRKASDRLWRVIHS